MELSYDWQSFQSIFYPKRRASHSAGAAVAHPAYLVVEGSVIVAGFAEGEDISDWIGADYGDMAAEMPHRELLLFERAKFDEWLSEAAKLPHLHEQVEFLRAQAGAQAVSSRRKHAHPHLGHPHFLLEAVQGWWGKVLPSAYGLFLRLEGAREQDLLLVMRRGRIEAFHEPDLSSLGRERRKVPADVVKYLSEKHLLPVQGIFVPAAEWAEWTEASSPWRKVAISVRANQSRLVPFRWGLVSLMASKAFFGA